MRNFISHLWLKRQTSSKLFITKRKTAILLRVKQANGVNSIYLYVVLCLWSIYEQIKNGTQDGIDLIWQNFKFNLFGGKLCHYIGRQLGPAETYWYFLSFKIPGTCRLPCLSLDKMGVVGLCLQFQKFHEIIPHPSRIFLLFNSMIQTQLRWNSREHSTSRQWAVKESCSVPGRLVTCFSTGHRKSHFRFLWWSLGDFDCRQLSLLTKCPSFPKISSFLLRVILQAFPWFSYLLSSKSARIESIYGKWGQKDVSQHCILFIRRNSRGMFLLNIHFCTSTVLKRPVTADELLMPGAPYVRKTFTVCLQYFSLFSACYMHRAIQTDIFWWHN